MSDLKEKLAPHLEMNLGKALLRMTVGDENVTRNAPILGLAGALPAISLASHAIPEIVHQGHTLLNHTQAISTVSRGNTMAFQPLNTPSVPGFNQQRGAALS